MENKIFEVKVNSSETNKDLGFEVLETSGLSVVCLEDERYIIPEKGMVLLRERGVKYELLRINGMPNK